MQQSVFLPYQKRHVQTAVCPKFGGEAPIWRQQKVHISPVLKSLHWLPVSVRIEFKILLLTFRALHGQAPSYIRDLLCPYVPSRRLRSLDQGLLMVPRTRFRTRGDRSFQAVAPKLWNDLPLSIRSLDSVDAFKSELKTHLFLQAF